MSLIAAGNTTLDDQFGVLTVGTHFRCIPPSPAKLLAALMRKPGQAFSRAALCDLLWGDRDDGPGETVVQVHIFRVRAMLLSLGSDCRITTRRQIGYLLEAPDADRRHVHVFGPSQERLFQMLLAQQPADVREALS